MDTLKTACKRIERMEEAADRLEDAAGTLRKAVEKMEGALPAVRQLQFYYTQGEWMDDYELDACGKLPAALKRGILSEDQLYSQLSDLSELRKEMQTLLEKMKSLQ